MLAIAPTDISWFQFLRDRPSVERINFWTPTPWNVKGLTKGSRLYFMLKAPIRKIGGWGEFAGYENLGVRDAWRRFGEGNGVPNEDQLLSAITGYAESRAATWKPGSDPEIGCIVLENAVFLDDSEFFDPEPLGFEFAPTVVKLKYFRDADVIPVGVERSAGTDPPKSVFWVTVGMKQPQNYTIGVSQGVWGVPERLQHRLQPVSSGDYLLFYGREAGFSLCEVESDPYQDETPVWPDGIYPHRVRMGQPLREGRAPLNDTFDCLRDAEGKPYRNAQAAGAAIRGTGGVMRRLSGQEVQDLFERLGWDLEGLGLGTGNGRIEMNPDVLEEWKRSFLRRHPDFVSFDPPTGSYLADERAYKDELADEYRRIVRPLLSGAAASEDATSALIPSLQQLLARKLESYGKVQNLLGWRYHTFLRDLDPSRQTKFAEALADLILGEGAPGARIEQFNDFFPMLLTDRTGPAVTRSFPTLFLMLEDPDQEMFIRTDLFTKVFKELLDESPFANKPLSAVEYDRVLSVAGAIREELHGWGWQPKDLIDVQSFLWAATSGDDGPTGWIFQGNPDYFDIAGAVRSLDQLTWSVSQHADDIAEGDRVYFWQSGPDGGVVGVGTVTTGPVDREIDPGEEEFIRSEPERFSGIRPRALVSLDRRLAAVVGRKLIRSHPSLADLSIIRAPQGTNFAVTREQMTALDSLIDWVNVNTILKVAPGEHGDHWEECLEGGYICIGWDELGDLRAYGGEDELRDAHAATFGKTHAPTVSREVKSFLQYRDLKPGDVVVANRGKTEVLGIGRVVEPGYEWRPDRPDFHHIVNVTWDTSLSGPISERGGSWNWTIQELEQPEYQEILGQLLGGEEPDHSSFQDLVEGLARKGFYFPNEIVSNYLLALETKRFAILTGISGTGKTRLAMEVAAHFQPQVRLSEVEFDEAETVPVKVRPYMLKYRQLILPAALRVQLRLSAGDPSATTGRLRLRYPGGEAEQAYWRRPDSGHVELSLSGDFRKWFESTLREDDTVLLDVVETDGDQVVSVIPAAPRYREVPLDNREVVAVRPDWTDGRGLLGYFNPITGRYSSTPFLKLLLRASAEAREAAEAGRDAHPFFVILDEMNLARVEHYFSDFLSCLESDEPLHLHDEEDVAVGRTEDELAIPRRLRVPHNLYFTGTVNVDESTYMFSPKVLDRAFTIELNEVDLERHGREEAPDARPGELRLERLGTRLVKNRRPHTKDWEAFEDLLGGQLYAVTVQLNRLLAGENRHFGYRVANEIARFVNLAAEQAVDDSESLWAALDLALLQKVLPKFHGTQQELQDMLREVLAFTVSAASAEDSGDMLPIEERWKLEDGALVTVAGSGEASGAGPRLPRTAGKVWRMLQRLKRLGFTSYIE